MPEYMPSSEAALAMTKKWPAHRIKGGLRNVVEGVAITAGSDAGGWYLFNWAYPDHDWKSIVAYIGGIAVGLIGTYVGGRKFADGVTSLADPLFEHRQDGLVYYRNGGYIDRHSAPDRRFGYSVRPIDDPDVLSVIQNREGTMTTDRFFLNAATLRSIRLLEKEIKTRKEGDRKVTTTKWVDANPEEIAHDPLPMDYRALFTVEFNGVRFPARTENGRSVKFLAGVQQGSALYLLGRYEKGRKERFDVEDAGDALLRDAD